MSRFRLKSITCIKGYTASQFAKDAASGILVAAIAMGIFSGQLKGFFGLEMGEIPVKVMDKFIAYGKVIRTVHVPRHTLVYEIEGPFFFATVDEFMSITATASTRVIILRMRSVPVMDITAWRCLEGLLERCQKACITLLLSHVTDQPMSAIFRHS